jgi:chromosome segregation ATPase
LVFKDCLTERKPPLLLSITGNLISEAAMRTIEDWQNAGASKENNPPPEVIVSSPSHSLSYQNELLQKEVASLRHQCVSLQTVYADVQRQLDSSALRVAELEQALSREEYRSSHLNEALKHANSRLSVQADEQAALAAAWDRERETSRTELINTRRSYDGQLHTCTAERDAWKERAHTYEVISLFMAVYASRL